MDIKKAVILTRDLQLGEDIRLLFKASLPDFILIFCSLEKEAIQLINNQSPALVIIDYDLEHMEQTTFTRRVRALTIAPIMVVMTPSQDYQDRIKAIEYGADRFLTKPIKHLEFAAHIRSLLRTG